MTIIVGGLTSTLLVTGGLSPGAAVTSVIYIDPRQMTLVYVSNDAAQIDPRQMTLVQ